MRQDLSVRALRGEAGPSALVKNEAPAQFENPSIGWESGSDKARILAAVFRGQAASRKDLVDLLSLRSTSVSELVSDLLRSQLLAETADRRTRRGRPSLVLIGNSHRIAVLVFTVASQAMHATVVNLLGQTIAHEACELRPDCTNEIISESIELLSQRTVARLNSNTKLVGARFSLPGLVNTVAATWVFSTRWPLMRRLDLRQVMQKWDVPVSACRNLDAELHARLARDKRLSSRTMLFHWGYGIGVASTSEGQVRFSGTEGFGEVGHWRWSDEGAECRCGRRGCLETTSALWSLGPALLGEKFDPAASEESIARIFREMDLLEFPSIQIALRNVVLTLANLCRVGFPRTVVMSGPFVANAKLWVAFREAFLHEGILLDLPGPDLIADERSRELEMLGAAGPLLSTGLERLMGRPSD
jgi:predicted NBD/HSP70 family sugar kinase